MGDFDLLAAVQPQGGWYAVVGIKGESRQQELVDDRDEFDAWVEHFTRRKYNVFFGVAKYKDDSSRAKNNVEALRALWLDIDCGPTKDYPTQAEGLAALREFCKTTGLPKPIIVNSGRGWHVYWALTEAVNRAEWEPAAKKLKEVCAAQGLLVDNACFEAARILRVPGTFNHKGEEPLPVVVEAVGKPIAYDDICKLLGVGHRAVALLPERRTSALGDLIQSSIDTSFAKIMKRGEKGCAQLNSCYQDRETLSEPRWFNALSIAKFCKDRDKAIHKLSADYPDYDPGQTEQKLEHILGPHSCAEFEKNNPGGCGKCPHKKTIKSPIQLGRELVAAPDDDTIVVKNKLGEELVYKVPKCPFPYVRGKGGGVWRAGETEESEPILVFEDDLYVVKHMIDPNDDSVVLVRHHKPRGGIAEFTIPCVIISDPTEIRKALARKAILAQRKKMDLLADYVIVSAKQIIRETEEEQVRTQFGWADKDGKFIVGDREIGAEGTYYSAPSSVTGVLSDHMTATGSMEKWKEVFNLYGRPGLEAHAFAAATAFGAPLLKFSGQRGAIINVIHPNSGTGKTTILHMANSVWGDPVRLCSKKDDTFNSKVFKLGVLCNLPVCFDEMTNTDPKQLSELAYLITQGTGKDRMKASSNELRVNHTSWQTVALCSSNSSFYEKLEVLKNSPQGELMRIVEFHLDYSNAIDTELGKQMFDHQLLENYGHAGDIYARFLVTEYKEVQDIYASIQHRIDTSLKLTQRERFWSAAVAANIAGIYIAKRLKLCDWDIARIFKWACNMIRQLRSTTTPPTASENYALSEFLLSRIDNTLVVNDEADRRSKMQTLPTLEPKRELQIRFEPDTAKVFITVSAFREYCASRSIGYRETVRKMKQRGSCLGSDVKRMSKGMKINVPGVQALIFDANHSDIMGLHDLLPSGSDKETLQ